MRNKRIVLRNKIHLLTFIIIILLCLIANIVYVISIISLNEIKVNKIDTFYSIWSKGGDVTYFNIAKCRIIHSRLWQIMLHNNID